MSTACGGLWMHLSRGPEACKLGSLPHAILCAWATRGCSCSLSCSSCLSHTQAADTPLAGWPRLLQQRIDPAHCPQSRLAPGLRPPPLLTLPLQPPQVLCVFCALQGSEATCMHQAVLIVHCFAPDAWNATCTPQCTQIQPCPGLRHHLRDAEQRLAWPDCSLGSGEHSYMLPLHSAGADKTCLPSWQPSRRQTPSLQPGRAA